MTNRQTQTTEPEPWCCLCGQRHVFTVSCDPQRVIALWKQETAGWQPIATAPRPSLLDPFSGPVVELRWENHGGHTARGYYNKDHPNWFTLPSNLPVGVQPTHWRPVP